MSIEEFYKQTPKAEGNETTKKAMEYLEKKQEEKRAALALYNKKEESVNG